MADEQDTTDPGQTTPDPGDQPGGQDAAEAQAAAQQPRETPDHQSQSREAILAARVRDLEATLGALATREQPVQSPGSDVGVAGLSGAAVRALREAGLSEQDIREQAPILVPWIRAIITPAAIELGQGLTRQQENVLFIEASQDGESFPLWNKLRKEIREVREASKKAGQSVTPTAAYHAAIANKISTPEGQKALFASDDTSARSRASDASATTSMSGSGTRATGGGGKVLTPDDIMKLPEDQRDAAWDRLQGAF